MSDIFLSYYDWIKAFHVIAIIAWMAGMLYLPRLFVYHADAAVGSESSETFKIMERRLLKYIINPAMITTLILGAMMFIAVPALFQEGWMHVKLTAVILMFGVHGVLSKHRKLFERDERAKPAKFYKIINEVPTALMIVIVIMAIAQPF